MNILSIHSSVALGHVGNSGVAFALRRLGHDVWPVNSVVFSNHPAHGGLRGRVTPAAEIADLVEGLAERGVLARCDAVLTGYLGAAEHTQAVMDAVLRVREANPQALWLCDPVIGDGSGGSGRIYVKPGIAEWMRDAAVPQADILTPNAFELQFLSGRVPDSIATALAAIDGLRARMRTAAAAVTATGLRLTDAPPRTLTTLAVDAAGAWRVTVPEIAHPAHGAGDVFAAVLLGRMLAGEPLARAAQLAAASLYGIIAATADGAADLALVAAQDEIVSPGHAAAVATLR